MNLFWTLVFTRTSVIIGTSSLSIAGSIHLVSNSLYLVLQIPVMLMYCSYLREQIN